MVTCRFKPKEKSAIKELTPSGREILERFQRMAFNGYKVGISWSPAGDCYVLSMTCKERTNPDLNKVFSIFLSDFDLLLSAFVWVVDQLDEKHSLSNMYGNGDMNSW